MIGGELAGSGITPIQRHEASGAHVYQLSDPLGGHINILRARPERRIELWKVSAHSYTENPGIYVELFELPGDSDRVFIVNGRRKNVRIQLSHTLQQGNVAVASLGEPVVENNLETLFFAASTAPRAAAFGNVDFSWTTATVFKPRFAAMSMRPSRYPVAGELN